MNRDKYVAVEFAWWIETHCIESFTGYLIAADLSNFTIDHNEYKVDELFDYWYENIFNDEFDKIEKQ